MNFSVLLDTDKCTGCTNCMKKCPTQAIRIKGEKAHIEVDKCIHCGECIKACPHHAYAPYNIENRISPDFKCTIAIPSTTIYGQFPKGTEIYKIQNSILKLGFNYVYDESYASELVSKAINKRVKETNNRPLISTNCPAAVRLIKIRYPSLIDNLITIEPPMDVAARLAKSKVHENLGISYDDIGVCYISPCPAKMLCLTNPLGARKSEINKVIPLKSIYGDLYREVSKDAEICYSTPSLKGIKWAFAGGQSEASELDSYIAVYGMENIINILEEIENGKLDDVDYVEMLVCTEGCVGGTFNVVNPHIAKKNINYIISHSHEDSDFSPDIEKFEELYKEKFFESEILTDDLEIGKLSLAEAIKRSEMIEEISMCLPGLDCGSCGAPTCLAFAEDVYDKKSNIRDCVFLKAQKGEKNESK